MTKLEFLGLVIAILAAIVASQAMITGAFQLLMQVMNMSYAPHIKLVSIPLPLRHPLFMALNLHLSRRKKAD